MDEKLARQIEFLRSDDRLKEKLAGVAALSPEERLELAGKMAGEAATIRAGLPEDVRDRLVRELPDEVAAVALRRLAGREPTL